MLKGCADAVKVLRSFHRSAKFCCEKNLRCLTIIWKNKTFCLKIVGNKFRKSYATTEKALFTRSFYLLYTFESSLVLNRFKLQDHHTVWDP